MTEEKTLAEMSEEEKAAWRESKRKEAELKKVMSETIDDISKRYEMPVKEISEAIVGKPEPKRQNRFNILSYNELQSYEAAEDDDWLVQGLIKPKNTGVLGGASSTLKSWLSLALACSVANGTPFLETFTTKRGAVLFVDRENFLPELKKRSSMVLNGLGINGSELPIYFLSEQHLKLDNSDDLASLENFVKEKNIVLIVADTYRRLISFEENNADDVSVFFSDMIKPFCERTGASFLFIHHHKKHNVGTRDDLEMLRGSSDFGNFVDFVLQVQRNGDTLTIKQSKMRGAREIPTFSLKVDSDEDNYFKFIYSGNYQPLDRVHKAVEILLIWFSENKITQFKSKEAQSIAENNGIKRSNFYSALDEMVNRGLITKTGHGTYDVCPNSPNSTIGQSEQLENKDKSKSNSPTYICIGQLDNQKESWEDLEDGQE